MKKSLKNSLQIISVTKFKQTLRGTNILILDAKTANPPFFHIFTALTTVK
jgi:hypothetical protein